jgi:adenylosuccinate synthase
MDADSLAGVTPIFETLPGWTEDLSACKTIESLPANARALIDRIASATGIETAIVSVGPERNETIVLKAPFER